VFVLEKPLKSFLSYKSFCFKIFPISYDWLLFGYSHKRRRRAGYPECPDTEKTKPGRSLESDQVLRILLFKRKSGKNEAREKTAKSSRFRNSTLKIDFKEEVLSKHF
jgi:hypothetical protein